MTSIRLAGQASTKQTRQEVVLELVARGSITSQGELAEQLRRRGFPATQATVSRDITELGLAKVARGNRHVYVAPADIAPPGGGAGQGAEDGARESAGRGGLAARPIGEERLRRILIDVPMQIGRSGLILVLTGAPGTASIVAQAIDESGRSEPEGTLAGDNTLLVLFRDEDRLDRWSRWFQGMLSLAAPPREARSTTSPITEAHA